MSGKKEPHKFLSYSSIWVIVIADIVWRGIRATSLLDTCVFERTNHCYLNYIILINYKKNATNNYLLKHTIFNFFKQTIKAQHNSKKKKMEKMEHLIRE